MAYPYPHLYPRHGLTSATFLQRPSFSVVAKQIYLRDGVTGFFRGLGPTFLRTFPVNASALFVYEETMRILGAEKVLYHMLIMRVMNAYETLKDTQLN